MQFLSAASAWLFVSLLAIAAMYILKKKYRDTEVASHLLWRRMLQEQEANRPWQRLRSRWLLLLQLLAASLLVLALMEPVVMKPHSSDELAVLVLDRSVSMTALSRDETASNGKTRFELAVEAAKDWMDSQPGGRPIRVIATGDVPVEIAASAGNRQELYRALDELMPYYGRTDHTAALSLADSLHHGRSGGVTIVFTDGKWRDAEEANGLQLYHPLQIKRVGLDSDTHNGSILHFSLRPDAARPGYHQAAVTVRNDSDKAREYTVEIYSVLGDRPLEQSASRNIVIAPGEWGSAELSGLAPAAYYKARLLPLNDSVRTDNTAYGFPVIQRSSQALVVSKEGNLFLEKALLLSGVVPVKSSPDSVPPSGEQAEGIDWIVADGTYEQLQKDEAWSALLKNKPLWLIDHPENDGSSSVPAGTTVQTQEHPVTSYMTFSDTHIGRMHKLGQTDGDWGEAVLTYGGVPAILAGNVDGKPRLRYTFKLQDTDLPLRPEFPVLVFQSAEWMSGGTQGELGTAVAGDKLDLSFHAEAEYAEWETVELAGAGIGQEQRMKERMPAAGASGAIEAPEIPGLYRLQEHGKSGELLASRYLAVTAHPDELQPAAELRLMGIDQEDQTGSGEAGELPAAPSPLLSWAVVLILVVLLAEWEVYRRGHAS
ncbi:VWA domain-containing protein [Paenibacillus pinisoli]|uniref:VWA domain-containing protein n=1 Tax=Paenibacillus pinisoli TaxID=1276110 RepID=A0A3A6PLS7_9BACL|nr:VWA domain-containing protein [Paenibacillus pinisoli]RJX40696.1 VWA domain-containing protein [Paenibacillus pinisoli]